VLDLEKKCKDNCDIIQSFDEVLLKKASKITVEEVKAKFADFMTVSRSIEVKQQIQQQIDNCKEMILDIDKNQAIIRKEAGEKIQGSVHTFVYQIKKELHDAYGVKPVDARDFEARLALKADAKEMQLLYKWKAEVIDQEKLNWNLNFIKNQTSQVIISFIDFLKRYHNYARFEKRELNHLNEFTKQLIAIYNCLKRSKQYIDPEVSADHQPKIDSLRKSFTKNSNKLNVNLKFKRMSHQVNNSLPNNTKTHKRVFSSGRNCEFSFTILHSITDLNLFSYLFCR